MAYSAPPHWTHGDEPDGAAIQTYADSLDYLHGLIGDAAHNFAVLWSYENVDAGFAGSDFYLVHRFRWLIYRGDGELVDPSGAGETLTLSGDGVTLLAYDLDDVEWMTPGRLYIVKDCLFALENDNTTGVTLV